MLNKRVQTALIGVSSLAAVVLVTAGIVSAQSNSDTRLDTSNTVVTAETAAPSPIGLRMDGPRKGDHLQSTADMLGIKVEDLKAKLEAGTPMYKIMADQGWTYTKLQEKKLADLETRLKEMVTAGFLTQAQADQFLKNAQERQASGEMMPFGEMGHHRMGPGLDL